MSHQAILTQIETILKTVDDIGEVHTYERWAASWDAFLDLFKSGEVLNGWMISRVNVYPSRTGYGEIQKAHIYQITGFCGLKDDEKSEHDAQGIVENIVDAFIDKQTLNGTAVSTNPEFGPMEGAFGLIIDTFENRMFGNVLCHYAEGRLCAVENYEE